MQPNYLNWLGLCNVYKTLRWWGLDDMESAPTVSRSWYHWWDNAAGNMTDISHRSGSFHVGAIIKRTWVHYFPMQQHYGWWSWLTAMNLQCCNDLAGRISFDIGVEHWTQWPMYAMHAKDIALWNAKLNSHFDPVKGDWLSCSQDNVLMPKPSNASFQQALFWNYFMELLNGIAAGWIE